MSGDTPNEGAGLIGFDARMRTRFVFGSGTIDRLGELAAEFSPTSILLVSDPGIIAAGHVDRALHSLKAHGFRITVFDGVIENPTTREVDACVKVARECAADLIVGVGGGSTMDTAKGCNFVLTNGGRMQDYWGVGKATKPMLPLIVAPTTAGTGSEAQSFALIADADSHQKMACGDHKAAAAVAILDPTLTLTQPTEVAALTGIDAVAHALESAVSIRRNELSSIYSREAFRLTFTNLPKVLREPDSLVARGKMLLGASLAGMAIENSMLGAAHALANPLTARYGVTHGLAVGLALPEVLRFNSQDAESAAIYAELAGSVGEGGGDSAPRDADWIARGITELLAAARLERSLNNYDIDSADIPGLAAAAAEQWTGTFNPVPVAREEFELLYNRILDSPVFA